MAGLKLQAVTKSWTAKPVKPTADVDVAVMARIYCDGRAIRLRQINVVAGLRPASGNATSGDISPD